MMRTLSLQSVRRIAAWSVVAVAAAQLALADPALEAPRTCEVTSPREATALADKLFERREYRHAGVCYQAAGDLVHANLAFLKAVGPQSDETARGLKTQGDAAKSLFASVERAFHGNR